MEKKVPQNDPFSCSNGSGTDAFLCLSRPFNSQTTITACFIHHIGVACKLTCIIVGVDLVSTFARQSHMKIALFDVK